MQLDTFYEDNSLHKRQHTGLRDRSGICVATFVICLSSAVLLLVPLDLRVREETSVLHWNVLVTVRGGSEKVPGESFLSSRVPVMRDHVIPAQNLGGSCLAPC